MSDLGETSLGERVWRGDIESIPQKNRDIVTRLYEQGWEQGKLSTVDQFVARNYSGQSNLLPGSQEGIDGYKRIVNTWRAAFSDLSFKFDQVLAEGDRLAIRQTGQGTHSGPFLGISPTNKQVTFGCMLFLRFDGGRVVEEHSIADLPGLMSQLGSGGGN
jgi:predicted ester cyclase